MMGKDSRYSLYILIMRSRLSDGFREKCQGSAIERTPAIDCCHLDEASSRRLDNA